MSAVMELRNIHVDFGGNQVLKGVDLSVDIGFTGLIGPNGAGKTTIFNVVTGYVRPSAGQVLLNGVEITGRGAAQVARAGVARTFQTPKLVPDMTVLDNVLLGLDGRRGLRGRAAKTRAMELLDVFGLADGSMARASSVPLASQKVVEVVRAMVGSPGLVLLDEPAAGLSAADVEQLVPPLLQVAQTEKLAVVIIEHDIELVSRLCSRVAVLHIGRTIAEGTPKEVMSHPEVLEAYLGASFAVVD